MAGDQVTTLFKPLYKALLAVAAILLLLSGCLPDSAAKTPPVAKKGVLDLRNWDFQKDGNVNLNGEWQFFWNQFLDPKVSSLQKTADQTGYLELPGLWNDYEIDDRKLSGHGFATFRLVLLLPDSEEPFALKVFDMATAYTIWLDGNRVMSNGIVGKTAQTMQPQFLPKVTRFSSRPGRIVLTLHVSNFHHKKGGAWMPIVLGPETSIRKQRDRSLAFELVLFGSLLVMAFYQAGLFILRRNDPSPAYFSLVCFLSGLWSLLVGERFLVQLFPDFSWELYQKIEYLAFFLSISFSVMLITSITKAFSNRFARLILLVSFIFSFVTVVTPARIFSQGLIGFHLLLIGVALYGFYTFTRILISRRDDSTWFILGVLALMTLITIDILGFNNLIPLFNLAPIGLFFFIFFHSITLSTRFSKAFVSLESVSAKLTQSNDLKDQLLLSLKESEKKYRELIENMDDAFFIVNAEGRLIYLSPASSSIFQYSSDEMTNFPGIDFVFPEDVKPVAKAFKQAIRGESKQLTARVIQKKGDIRWVRINIRPFYESGQITGTQGFVTDITERKKSEELIIQTEKMMSLGGLAAGMAHELNNPLGGILQGVQNIQRRLSPNLESNLEVAKEYGIDLVKLNAYMEKRKINSFFTGIKEAGTKASEIILNMLQFSRRSESRLVFGNLAELMDKTLDLAGKDYNLKKNYDFRNIIIIKEYDANLPPVPYTETELEQVLLNLLKNAAWSTASQNSQATPQITLRIKIEEGAARIEVEDNGPGIDEDDRKRVFEPFFTTKPVGEGTGLGLSVSYMIITNNHKGSMEVDSKAGTGARFIIKLPLTREPAA